MKLWSSTAFAATLAIVLNGAGASAQAPAGPQAPTGTQGPGGTARPYQGLFGGAGVNVNAHQTVNLSASFGENYDNTTGLGSGPVPGISPLQSTGFYQNIAPSLDIMLRGERMQLSASGGSDVRYYRSFGEFVAVDHYEAATLTAQVAHHTTMFVSESIAYTPASLYALFPTLTVPAAGELVTPGGNYTATDTRSLTSFVAAGLNRTLSGRGSLSFNTDYRSTQYIGSPTGLSDLRSYDIGGTYSYALNRDGKLRLGYTYRQAQYSTTGPQPVEHDIDIGVDYRWPLSRTRRTTFGFNVGSTVVNGTLGTVQGIPSPSAEFSRQFRVTGDALLTHQIGRSWRVRGIYNRGVGMIEGFPGPVFSDAWTAATDGYLNRRTDLVGSIAYANGQELLAARASNYLGYTGNLNIRFAMSKTWALYTEYVYYRYDLKGTVTLPPSLANSLDRSGVRVGLTLWAPLRQR